MDVSAIHEAVERKTGKKMRFASAKKHKFLGRGSMYLALNRMIFIEDIEKKIKRVK